eukprot:scaffold23223_cov33-Tisochrysis_lutea.AAC.2
MAPELLMRQEYGVGVDWWTLGCLLFEMVTGNSPFADRGLQKLVEDVTTTDPYIPRRISPDCTRLIRGLMNRDASLRLNGLTMRAEPFYHSFDWGSLLRKEIPAPYLPTEEDSEADVAPNAEQCARLQVGAYKPGTLCQRFV